MWSRLTVAGVCPLPVSRGGALETRLLWMRKQAPREGEEPGLGRTVRQLGPGPWRGASGDLCSGKAEVSWSGGQDDVGSSQRQLAPHWSWG